MPVIMRPRCAPGICSLVLPGALWVHADRVLAAAEPAWFARPQFVSFPVRDRSCASRPYRSTGMVWRTWRRREYICVAYAPDHPRK